MKLQLRPLANSIKQATKRETRSECSSQTTANPSHRHRIKSTTKEVPQIQKPTAEEPPRRNRYLPPRPLPTSPLQIPQSPRINHRRRIIHLLKIPTPTLFHLPLRCFSPPLSNHDRTRPDTRRFCGRTPRHRIIPIYSRYLLIPSPTHLRPTSRRTRCAKYAAASRDRRRGQRDPSFFFTRGPVTATAEARFGDYTWSS